MTFTTFTLTVLLHFGGGDLGKAPPSFLPEYTFFFLSEQSCLFFGEGLEQAWASSPHAAITWDCLPEEEEDLL